MIVEREIEEALIEKLSAALSGGTGFVPSVRFTGAWSVANDGEVKGQSDDSPIAAAVAVGIRSYDTFQTPTANFACALALSVRRDACPTGAEIANVIEPLMAMLHDWNADEEAVFSDLATAHFSPSGFQLAGGDGPSYDSSAGAWTVSLTFNLKGTVF